MKNNPNKPDKSKKQFIPPTFRCKYCPQIFQRDEVVCFRCATCQDCGQITNNRYGNECIHCHCYRPLPPYNQGGLTHTHHLKVAHREPHSKH